ncbi:MAG: PKD domain-containing protein [Bacteroidota bacterium]
MKDLIRKAGLLFMVILVFTFLGCEDDDEGEALPAVTAGFTFDLIPNTGSVSFINISENADTFEWDFGNETTSTEINPTVTFVSGTYTVSLTANNVAGASATFEDEITISIPEPPGPVALPIDFDATNVAYDAIVGDNIGFSIVTNPETGNGNTTNVGQMVAGGGQFQNVQFPLGTAVDFSGENKTIQLELFASTEIAVLVKFENGAGGARDVEVLTTHTGSGWETLNFDFGTNGVASFIDGDPQNGQPLVPDGQYGQMILFIGFNTDPGVEGTFLVDNITQTTAMGGGGGDMPTEAAPTPPARDAADVISLFSNAYTNIMVDTFFTGFSQGGGQTDVQVEGDDVLLYTDLDFAGIETLTETVDLTSMTNFSIDVWTATSFDLISRVVDFGGDGFDGGNDTQADETTTLTAGQWSTIDVSIADLQAAGLTATPTDFSQLILDIVDVTGTLYVDNIYFYNDGSGGGGDMPAEAAPTPPARDAADVISLFSNAYTNIMVDTFFAGFSQGGGQTDVQVAGDDVLLYTDLDFAGIETLTETVDLTSMTNFSIDVWTATSFDLISRVVDFGGDGFDGGNDTQADERTTLTAGQWSTIDVSIADLQAAGLTATPTDFSQLILDVVDVTGTLYVDNIYFYNDGSGGGGDIPTMPAPTPPARDVADVISLFSNAYTNIMVDTFFAGFSMGAGQTNEQVASDDVLLYTDLDFAGIETLTETVDLTSMTNFSIDVWTATSFDLISRVVDFGGDGFGGGNDTQADERTTLTAGQWNTIDVSIADLQAAGLTATPTDFSQLILDVVDVTGTIYVDNIYFYSDGSGGGSTCPAPPAGELLSNGGFEANSGDGACWQLNQGGGSVTIIDTDANTGTYSARLVTGTAQVPNLKQERFAPGIAGNQSVQVTFSYKITSAFVDGAILQVLAFSERSVGGAVASDLGNADTSTIDVWQTYTGSFTTDAAVDEGISLLIQATCGGAGTCAGEVLIDDVVVTNL